MNSSRDHLSTPAALLVAEPPIGGRLNLLQVEPTVGGKIDTPRHHQQLACDTQQRRVGQSLVRAMD